MIILNRIPKLSQLIPVYAVIALVVYTWTILWFFWKLPSWLDFLNMSEIGTVFSYVLATNLIESLLVLCAIVVLCVILPKKWFLDLFVARGTSVVLFGLSYMIYLAYQVQAKVDHPTFSFKLMPIILESMLILIVGYVVGGIQPVRKVLEFFADQATIFLYLSIPLSIVSVLIVLFRLII